MEMNSFITLDGLMTFSGATGAAIILWRVPYWEGKPKALVIISAVIGFIVAANSLYPVWTDLVWPQLLGSVLIAFINTVQIYLAALGGTGMAMRLLSRT